MSDETGEVKILAEVAGDVADPALFALRSTRPSAPEVAPSRDRFRRARRSRRWRFRASVASVIVGLVLMAAGLVFVLSDSTSEIGPTEVQGQTTIKGSTTEATTSAPTTTVVQAAETTIRGDQPTVSVK